MNARRTVWALPVLALVVAGTVVVLKWRHGGSVARADLPLAALESGYLGMSLPSDFSAFSESSPWRTPIARNPVATSCRFRCSADSAGSRSPAICSVMKRS